MTNLLPPDFWLRLDNAAKLFPAVQDKNLTSVFRITAVLTRPVVYGHLQDALRMVEMRYPYFKVRLKTGFFWYYLEPSNAPIKVEPDFHLPCRSFGKGEILLRVLVKDESINVEFSHIVTDGAGAFEFMKTLLMNYFDRCQDSESSSDSINTFDQQIHAEELEDAYNRYFKKINAPKLKLPNAFFLPFALKPSHKFDLLTAIIPINSIVEKAKEQGVSITEFLIGVYMYSLQEIYEHLHSLKKWQSNRIIRIQVPLNLRRIYPSGTMRNFSLFVLPGIDLRLGHYSFEEIVKTVYHQMRLETDK
jgi:hypothetical protein